MLKLGVIRRWREDFRGKRANNYFNSLVDNGKHENNQLTLIQTVDTYPKDSFHKTSYAGDMTIMDTGEFLFASNRGHDSVAVFKVDKETGLLTYIEFVDTDANPRVIQIFRGSFNEGDRQVLRDRWLVVAAQKGGSLESWEIKTKDRHGVLFETNYSYAVSEPVTIALGNQNYLKTDDKKK